jgi:hypothetical protein
MNNFKFSARNIAAIVLMALTVVFMFWPSVLGGVNLSLSDTRSMLSDLLPYLDGFPKFLSVVISIGFFTMIGLAALSIVLMVLNRSKGAVIAHVIVTLVVILALVIIMTKIDMGPSVALFLLPICSLAASILYQQDRS